MMLARSSRKWISNGVVWGARIAFIGWVVAVGYCYALNSHTSDPSTGRIYEISLHGAVYVTPWLGRAYELGMLVAVALFLLGWLLGEDRTKPS